MTNASNVKRGFTPDLSSILSVTPKGVIQKKCATKLTLMYARAPRLIHSVIAYLIGKTNYMLFRSRPPDLELHLKINNAEIPKVTATKFLGIIIDDRLNMKHQIQSVKSKLSSILSVMYKASQLITTAGMYTMYCSLFQPIFHTAMKYGVIIMLQMSNVYVSFKGAVRLICNADRLAHTNELYKELYILKFP